MAEIMMVCSHCGSEDVKKDAYAVWNKSEQEWEISTVFDKGAICEDCDGEASIKTVIKGEYYQPKFIEDSSEIEGYPNEKRGVCSFMVWTDKFELIKAHPNCTILVYHDDDIEDPMIMD